MRTEAAPVRTTVAATTALAIACSIVLGACGGDESEETAAGATTITIEEGNLGRADQRVIDRTRAAVDRYCVKVASAVSRGAAPSSAAQKRVVAELDRLADLARVNPDAAAPDGTSPSLALADIAESLEGSNCDARLVTKIEEDLAAIERG